MDTLNKILNELKILMPYLQDKYSVKDIGLFGSYIRDEQDSNSDLDIIISFNESPSLFKFVELENFLSDKLKIKVDLVMRTALKENLKDYILKEAILV